jgi:hypothetical protein
MVALSPLVCHVRRPLNKAPKQELQYATQVPNKKRVDQKMTVAVIVGIPELCPHLEIINAMRSAIDFVLDYPIPRAEIGKFILELFMMGSCGSSSVCFDDCLRLGIGITCKT